MDKRYWLGLLFPKLRPIRHLSSFAYLVDFIRANPSPSFGNRVDLYQFINAQFGEKPICFIELGVWKGESIDHWARLNSNPQSKFYGIDTFEGLPEGWQHIFRKSPKGFFNADGEVPAVTDPRITFVKGLIQSRLKQLLSTTDLSGSTLVVHFDADLYSATHFGLATLDILLSDTIQSYIAVFDEFSSVTDEFRAFVDYQSAFLRKYSVLGHVGKSYERAAIQIYI